MDYLYFTRQHKHVDIHFPFCTACKESHLFFPALFDDPVLLLNVLILKLRDLQLVRVLDVMPLLPVATLQLLQLARVRRLHLSQTCGKLLSVDAYSIMTSRDIKFQFFHG